MNVPYTVTQESVTVVLDGRPTTVKRGAQNFPALRRALLEEDWTAVRKNLTVARSVLDWAKGDFTLDRDGRRFNFKGTPLPDGLNDRIFRMADEGGDPGHLLKFHERLSWNPSHRSVEQLWRFLQNTGIPITEDGKFLAYKSVREDFKDVHSGRFDNRPGRSNSMPRNQISDDPRHACHVGLHVGSLEYASTFGGARIVIVEVDPADVVCVPYDHSSQKMRVCTYKVVGIHGEKLPSTTIPKKDVPRPVISNKKRPKLWQALDTMDETSLMEYSMDVLRKYASKGLHLLGASRLQGGKQALVEKIIEVRG